MEKLIHKENKIMQQESNHMFQDLLHYFVYRLINKQKKKKKQINFQTNKLNNKLAKAE